jgi:hypothetical protein
VVDALWRPLAREQLDRVRRGDARSHRLLELEPRSRRLARLTGPLDNAVVDA